MLSVGALLLVAAEGRHAGLVICSDVASYDARTTAEITQGAGSVALLVEPSPRLLELDLGTIGFCSKDVDDFFRPLGSRSPKVKGGYSIQCYTESLELAFRDHCRRRKEDPAAVLESTDLFALHTPFHNMPEFAMIRLLKSVLGLGPEAAREYLRSRGFYAGIAPVARIGNIYSGSLYLCLSFLLAERFQTLGEGLVGKSVLLASYGSGNTMAVLSGRVAAGAPSVLSRWNTESHLESGRPATWEEYEEWMRKGYVECDSAEGRCFENLDGRSFHLARLREDGYRLYGFRTASEEGDLTDSRGELAEPASVV
jgi:hydroxymethylglutaryl-CoA synthase